MPQGSCLTCIIFEGPVTLDDVEWMYSFHVLTMSSIQEQQYFVTELFTPSNFSPFFLLFLLFDLILYFSVAVAQEWIFFLMPPSHSLPFLHASQQLMAQPQGSQGVPTAQSHIRAELLQVREDLPALCSPHLSTSMLR